MADFSFHIHGMAPGKPEYNVVSTDFEGWKVKSRLKSTEPKRTWSVEIRGQNNTEKGLILAHYDGQNGFNIPFNWVVLPLFFVNNISTIYYVRYKDIEFTNPALLGNVWEFRISFVEEIV